MVCIGDGRWGRSHCWWVEMGVRAGVLADMRFRYRVDALYRGAHAVLTVFDTNDGESFTSCKTVFHELYRFTIDPVCFCCGFVGSKTVGDTDRARGKADDGETTRSAGRVVPEEAARDLCVQAQADYFEVDLGVDDGRVEAMFDTLLETLIRKAIKQKRRQT